MRSRLCAFSDVRARVPCSLLTCVGCGGRRADVDRTTPNNWLDDHFWIKVAYHSWRVPLPVNSNWWLMCKDDDNIPRDVRESGPSEGAFRLLLARC